MERHIRREVIDDAHFALGCLMQASDKKAKLEDFMIRDLLQKKNRAMMVSQAEFLRMVSSWVRPKT